MVNLDSQPKFLKAVNELIDEEQTTPEQDYYSNIENNIHKRRKSNSSISQENEFEKPVKKHKKNKNFKHHRKDEEQIEL